jgi:hypothetical protein
MGKERMIFLPTEPKLPQPEQPKPEEKRAYEKTAISGLFLIGGAIASRHWPVAVGPTLIYGVEFARKCLQYRKLTKQTSAH